MDITTGSTAVMLGTLRALQIRQRRGSKLVRRFPFALSGEEAEDTGRRPWPLSGPRRSSPRPLSVRVSARLGALGQWSGRKRLAAVRRRQGAGSLETVGG